MKAPSRFIYAYPIVGSILVLGALVAGLWLNYGPAARDARTVQLLESASNNVYSYYARTQILPDTLDQVMSSEIYYQRNIQPEDIRNAVTYNKLTDTTYSVCATFERDTRPLKDSSTGQSAVNIDYNFAMHDKGDYCFTREVYPNPR